tara:strand:+ start:369 stop:551 length:183 start_codon:yes stop_codon:yes gene_type:complete
MFSLTNILLFLNLVTLATYTFMPWKGIAKGTWGTCISYWISFFIAFAILIAILFKLDFIV